MTNYKVIAKDGTPIREYMNHMNGVETPLVFDFFTAVWMIGALCDGVVHINRPRFPVSFYVNVVLVSSSGITRRGYNPIYAGKVTNRRTYEELDEACPKGSDGKEYTKNIVSAYNDHSTLSSTTPLRLIQECHPSLIEPEVASKILFITSNQRKRTIPWPSVEPDKQIADTFMNSVKAAKDVKTIELNDAALRAFSSWYRRRDIFADPLLSGLQAHDDDHLLRIAGILCINDGSLMIQDRHVRAAIGLMYDVAEYRVELFSIDDTARVSRLISGVDRLRKRIIKAGADGIRHGNLYQSVRSDMNIKEYRLVIRIMHELGLIQITIMRSDGHKYAKLYRATDQINKELFSSTIISALKGESLEA